MPASYPQFRNHLHIQLALVHIMPLTYLETPWHSQPLTTRNHPKPQAGPKHPISLTQLHDRMPPHTFQQPRQGTIRVATYWRQCKHEGYQAAPVYYECTSATKRAGTSRAPCTPTDNNTNCSQLQRTPQ